MVALPVRIVQLGVVGILAVACVAAAQARIALTVKCVAISKTACKVTVPLAGGLPNQPFTVRFPGAGYHLQETGGMPVGKVDWELGPPASAPSNYRKGDTEYVSQINAATTNPPGSKAVITFAKASASAPAQTPSATVAKGSFAGTCGGSCSLAFSIGSGGTTLTNVTLGPPACYSGTLSIGTLPVSNDGFNVTIDFNKGAASFSLVGKILSATKATATIVAKCAGKTTTRNVTLAKHG